MNDQTTVIPPLPDEAPETTPRGGRHPVNIGHLVMGLAFAGLLTVWALYVSDTVPQDDLRWLLPVPWLLGGGAGLVAAVLTQRKRL
ncbi:hypothetical protein GCM10011584_01650 [Nocardioides phosphati]|uniref:DUF2530 domain-containing protein n=1 Tax=Nocardioides phosphati TaxID=1867775 RepID=A0ABQ2N6F7_9ACTN|nr:hypothetical protein [Nocardioides phosphati]GGO84340.1 hypothetical protein GCM10011584_01650 [Nocardioides phosphati]